MHIESKKKMSQKNEGFHITIPREDLIMVDEEYSIKVEVEVDLVKDPEEK
jgi:hypothetical protein